MDETKASPEQKPKSGDNLKQILIGIFLLSAIVYVTFGLISKKFGWDSQPTPVQIVNTPKPYNSNQTDTSDNYQQKPSNNNAAITNYNSPKPVKNNQENIADNNSSKPKPIRVDDPTKSKPIPVDANSSKPKAKVSLKPDNNNDPPEKPVEVKKPLPAIAHLSISGSWQTDNNEKWDITTDGENVTIRVYDPRNKYKNLMTGKLTGRRLNLTSDQPGSKGQGVLDISDDGKTMSGKVKFRITFNNYIATRID